MSPARPSSAVREPQRTIECVDAEIRSMREQLSSLTSRRQILTSHLLSSPHMRTLAPAPASAASSEPSAVSELCVRHGRESTTLLHRTLLPATAFACLDPSPSAPNRGRVLGVRFESFSARSRKYGKPQYLLLHRPWVDKDGRVKKGVRVHRHCFEEWAGVAGLAERYLSEKKDENEDEGEGEGVGRSNERHGDENTNDGSGQNLPGLVAVLRNGLVSRQRREDALVRLGEAESVRKMVFEDPERREASFHMRLGGLVSVRVDEGGNIEGVHATDGEGKRRGDLERDWKAKGHIDMVELQATYD